MFNTQVMKIGIWLQNPANQSCQTNSQNIHKYTHPEILNELPLEKDTDGVMNR